MLEIESSGLGRAKLDDALRLYIFYIMNEHVEPAERLCAKDPNILYSIPELSHLFPHSKFLYLVRDPRAVVFSLMGILKEKQDMAHASKYFYTWHQYNNRVSGYCDKVGRDRCRMVKYEDLILSPKETIASIAQFLGLEWTDDFLKRIFFLHTLGF
jgi:protein-tyrosine sulfotransferase